MFNYSTGPPEPPEPQLTIINLTHLSLIWAPPFTWTEYPVSEYRLVLTEQQSSFQLANRTVSPNVTKVDFSYGELFGPVCTLLEFRVTAKSAIGESVEGLTTGGFPISMFQP